MPSTVQQNFPASMQSTLAKFSHQLQYFLYLEMGEIGINISPVGSSILLIVSWNWMYCLFYLIFSKPPFLPALSDRNTINLG